MKKWIFFLSLLGLLISSNSYATTQVIVGGCDGNLSNSATRYCPVMGAWTTASNEVDIIMVVPTDGTFKNLRVIYEDPPGVGRSYTATFRTGSNHSSMSDTALSCVTSGAVDRSCSDEVDGIFVSAGTIISLSFAPSGTPTGVEAGYALEFEPSVAGETIVMGGNNSASTTVTRYTSFANKSADNVNLHIDVSMIVPTTGVVKKLFCYAPNAPNPGTMTIALYNSTADTVTSLSCAIAGTATTSNDTTNSFTLSTAGLLLSTRMVPSSSPSNVIFYYGYVLVPSNSGDFVIFQQTPDTAGNGEHHHIASSRGINWTSTSFGEKFDGMSGLSSTGYIKEFWSYTDRAPTSTHSVTYTLNLYDPTSPTDTSITTTYSGTEEGTKSQTGLTVNLANNSAPRWKAGLTGTPTVPETKFSLLAHIPSAAAENGQTYLNNVWVNNVWVQ